MNPQPGFGNLWPTVQADLNACDRRLLEDCEQVWKDVEGLFEHIEEQARSSAYDPGEAGTLGGIEALLRESGRGLLLGPAEEYTAARPLERVLEAIERHESATNDILRLVPSAVLTSGREVAEVVGPRAGAPVRTKLLSFSGRQQEFPMRRILRACIERRSSERATLDGDYFILLGRSCLAFFGPWQELRQSAIATLAGDTGAREGIDKRRERWFIKEKALIRDSRDIESRYGKWTALLAPDLGKAVLSAFYWPTPLNPSAEFRQACFRYWSRMQRAVRATLQLEKDLAMVALDGAIAARASLASLDSERVRLVHELDSVIEWLSAWRPENGAQGFPPPEARMQSGEDRTAEWIRAMQASAEAHLPSSVETIDPRHALPPRRSPWRLLSPRAVFLAALRKYGRPLVLEAFGEAEAAHRAIIREIERAREVVAFSIETAATDQTGQIAREGIDNALALTSHHRRIVTDLHAAVEERFVRAIAKTLQATHFRLEESRLGLLAQLARQSASEAMTRFAAIALAAMSEWTQRGRIAASRGYHQVLLRTGWEPPPVIAVTPVVERGQLSQVLYLRQDERELPMIYRRLFRMAPVDEPRFLVGREAEMGALSRAKQSWEMGHAVSVALVGARGSGKTSLLNCAMAGNFAEAPVIRAQFCERITDAAGMRGFLSKLPGLDGGDDLLKSLAGRKRIIILEELERTFLRRMNGFEGIRDLAGIISATSQSTLWIVSTNQHAYRFLDAVIQLGEYFSHRINAMAVQPEALKSAILLRHNLSGLRLEYPPPPKSDPRVNRLRNLLGFHRDPEERFFDRLYLQSEGIFRTAFQLWQEFIERVEGGVLYLENPAEPNYNPLISQLVLDDAFTLQAILQHGSLTESEHGEVFECPISQSRVRLEKLTALEFLESEPDSPGIRIRPEAQRVVHIALHRLNLV